MEEGIVIERVFNAPVAKVWQAWTDPDIIKMWWGPEGFTAPSISIDFRVGGKYVYAMQGPKGSQWDRVMYSAGVFKEIITHKKIITTDYFSDKDGNKIAPSNEGMDNNFPTEMTVTITFEEIDSNTTKLTIFYPKAENEAQYEAMLKSGMKEGWSSSLEKMAKSID